MTTLYPIGYASRMVPMHELRAVHEPKMHPEFARRLFAWIEAQGGRVGIGSGWRETQPVKPGVAPEGKSFHQSQIFASALVAYCAVDLVVAVPGKPHRAPTWSEVPAQGSDEAARWLVHCNVGVPGVLGSEPWHMQPLEIDGWQSWVNAGRLDPEPPEDDDMTVRYFKVGGDPDNLTVYATADGLNAYRLDPLIAGRRGVDPFEVPVISAGEAGQMMFWPGGLPVESVR